MKRQWAVIAVILTIALTTSTVYAHRRDTTAPTVPTGLAATASIGVVDLTWNASTDPDSAVAGYTIYRSLAAGGPFASIATSSVTSYADTTVAAATTYYYTVDAFDPSRNHSAQSTPVSVTTPSPDTTPPTVPAGLATTLAAVTEVDLAWSASTDPDSAVAGYTVYRSTSATGPFASAGTTTATSFADKTVSSSTTYYYTVDAFDASGNHSAQSAAVSATTPADTTPPTTPTGLSAPTVTATQVQLSWSASTDDVGVAGYTVYRGGVSIGTSTVTSFSDTTVAPSTAYSYTVDAFDAAGNHSAQSTALPVTTPSASDAVIAAAGDIACDPANSNFNGGQGSGNACRQLLTSNLITSAITSVLTLGDDQYDCGGYQAFLQSYDLSWGRVKGITYPSLGNHEYGTSSTTGGTDCGTNASGYFQYYGTSYPGISGVPSSGYYSYNIGAWHLIALNAECAHVSCSAGSAQETWLKQDLVSHNNTCTLAYWHQPAWDGSSSTTNVQTFWSDLSAAHADIVLEGHVHNYQRFSQLDANGNPTTSGIRQFIVGTGGRSFAGIPSAPGQQYTENTSFGILKLTLHATSYDWQFVSTSGTVLDSGSDNCVP